MYIYVYIYYIPHCTKGMSIFKRCLTSLNSEFFFSNAGCLTKAKELVCPTYLPIDGRRVIGIIHFPKVSVLCKMQSAASRN